MSAADVRESLASLPGAVSVVAVPVRAAAAFDEIGGSVLAPPFANGEAGPSLHAVVRVAAMLAVPHVRIRPIANSFIVPGGLFAAGEYPGSSRSTSFESAQAKLARFLDAGINSFIDLTLAVDGLASYQDAIAVPAAVRRVQVDVQRFPLSSTAVCDAADMTLILDAIDDRITRKQGLYVHCKSGVGATAMVVGWWLVRHGWKATEALDELDALFRSMSPSTVEKFRAWGSPHTEAQRNFVREWASVDDSRQLLEQPLSDSAFRNNFLVRPARLALARQRSAADSTVLRREVIQHVLDAWAIRHDTPVDANWSSVITRGNARVCWQASLDPENARLRISVAPRFDTAVSFTPSDLGHPDEARQPALRFESSALLCGELVTVTHLEYLIECAVAALDAAEVGAESPTATEIPADEEELRKTSAVTFAALTRGIPLDDPAMIIPHLPRWAHVLPLSGLSLPQRVINVFASARFIAVGDVLNFGTPRLMELRNFGRTSLRDFAECLHAYVASFAINHADEAEVETEADRGANDGKAGESAVVPSPEEPSTLALALEAGLVSLRERDGLALRQWLGVSGPPETLEEIGAQFSVSRERIRQLRNRAVDQLRQRWRWTSMLEIRLSTLLKNRQTPLYLDELAQLDPWFLGVTDNSPLLCRLIEEFAGDSISTWPLRGRHIATRCPLDQWSSLLDKARRALHDEIPRGVTREQARLVIMAPALAVGWPDISGALWNVTEPSLNFGAVGPQGEHQLVSVGTGIGKAISVLLHESPRAMHIAEIIDALRMRDLVRSDDYATRNMVRNAARTDGALLLGRSLYGLMKHLPIDGDTADELIAEVELIMSDAAPERQWHCSELLERISGRQPGLAEEIDQYALNAVMQGAGVAQDLGRLVWTLSGTARGPVERLAILEVCEEALVQAGGPLTKAQLRDAVSQLRGLNHNFLPPVSSRIVRLSRNRWGLADRDIHVSAASQQNALTALHRCLQVRQKGLHVTEVFDALNHHGFFPDPIFDAQELFGLAQSDCRFRLGRGAIVGLVEWADVRRTTLRRALEQVKERRPGAQTSDELCLRVVSMIERAIPQQQILWSASQSGFVFSPTNLTWDVAANEDAGQEINAFE